MAQWYIQYADVAVDADKASTVTATEVFEKSNLALVPFGVQEPRLITLEHNSWVLNNEFTALADQKLGYWSCNMSNANSKFQTPLTITVSLKNKFTSMGIQLRFKPETDQWSDELSITWYRDEDTLVTETYKPDNCIYFCKKTVENFNKVVITVTSISKPYTRLRISHIVFGLYRRFDSDLLLSANLLQELNEVSVTLPESKLDFEVNDAQNIEFMFQQKQPVNVYIDDKLWGSFYIKSSRRTSARRYQVNCEDIIGVLTDWPFTPAMYETETNAKQIIENILKTQVPLDMDAQLENATVKGYINAKSAREAIQQICFAIGATCCSQGTGGLKIFKTNTTDAQAIENERVYTHHSVDTSAYLTQLNVLSHTYTLTTDQKAGDDVVKIENEGQTKYYLHKTSETVIENPNITASAKPNILEIKEATLINTDNVAQVAQRVYDYLMKVNTHNFKFVLMAEKLGDNVVVETPYEKQKSGMLESMKLTLSGIIGVEGKYKF